MSCQSCNIIKEKCPFGEEHRLTQDIDLLTLSEDNTEVKNKREKEERKSKKKDRREKELNCLLQNVSALRNSGGGVLFIHILGQAKENRCRHFFDEFADCRLRELTNSEEEFTDVFEKKWLVCPKETEVANQHEFLVLLIKGTQRICTVSYNTKETTDNSIYTAKEDIVYKRIYKQENHEVGKPKIIFENFKYRKDLEEGRCIQFKKIKQELDKSLEQYIDNKTLNEIVNYVWEDLRLKEYITSFASLKGGGSLFLGIAEHQISFDHSGSRCSSKQYVFEGLRIDEKYREPLVKGLGTKIEQEIVAYRERDKLPVYWETAFHEAPENAENTIIEIAIGHVPGCVFYDTGPSAYKIKEGQVEKLCVEKWLTKFNFLKMEPRKADERLSCFTEWPTNDPFLPIIKQKDDAFRTIRDSFIHKGEFNVLSNEDSSNPHLKKTLRKMLYQKEFGLLCITDSLAVLLNIGAIEVPHDVLFEVLFFSSTRSVTLLCVVKCTKENEDEHHRYVLGLTRKVTTRLRMFTNAHLSLVYGVIDENDVDTKSSLDVDLQDMKKQVEAFCHSESLRMDQSKCEKVVDAIIAAIATTSTPQIPSCSEEEDHLWFLTNDHFSYLKENIDRKGIVYLDLASLEAENRFALEAAKRLQNIGGAYFYDCGKYRQIDRDNKTFSVIKPEDIDKGVIFIMASRDTDVTRIQMDPWKKKPTIWIFKSVEEFSTGSGNWFKSSEKENGKISHMSARTGVSLQPAVTSTQKLAKPRDRRQDQIQKAMNIKHVDNGLFVVGMELSQMQRKLNCIDFSLMLPSSTFETEHRVRQCASTSQTSFTCGIDLHPERSQRNSCFLGQNQTTNLRNDKMKRTDLRLQEDLIYDRLNIHRHRGHMESKVYFTSYQSPANMRTTLGKSITEKEIIIS